MRAHKVIFLHEDAAALADARLPAVEISGGNVFRVDARGEGKGAEERAAATAAAEPPSTSSSPPFLSGLLLRSLPVASTLATHGSVPVFDPDAKEEELAHSGVTVVVRAGDGALLAVEGGVRRSSRGSSSSGSNGESLNTGTGSESSGSKSSSFFSGATVPLSVLSEAAQLGRQRAEEAAEALSAALEAKKKKKKKKKGTS